HGAAATVSVRAVSSIGLLYSLAPALSRRRAPGAAAMRLLAQLGDFFAVGGEHGRAIRRALRPIVDNALDARSPLPLFGGGQLRDGFARRLADAFRFGLVVAVEDLADRRRPGCA